MHARRGGDRFPADYPIHSACYSNSLSTEGSKGVPAYRTVHLMSSFPHQGSYKADALSAELQGHIPGWPMLT